MEKHTYIHIFTIQSKKINRFKTLSKVERCVQIGPRAQRWKSNPECPNQGWPSQVHIDPFVFNVLDSVKYSEGSPRTLSLGGRGWGGGGGSSSHFACWAPALIPVYPSVRPLARALPSLPPSPAGVSLMGDWCRPEARRWGKWCRVRVVCA